MARPHISIPPGAAPPAVPSPAIDDFITVTPAEHSDDFEFLDAQDSAFDTETPSARLLSEEGLQRFQAGELSPADEEWYRLVPKEAVQVFDKTEVLRQCGLFEIIRSEKEYVEDMKTALEVFRDALLNTAPITRQRLEGFVYEVFYNMNEILEHHQRLLSRLFDRQLEQHPIIENIGDIILDAPYEAYIKHYPIAEAYHRKELHRNTRYQTFLAQCLQNPRVRKRDLISFLSRPVTRLPRLILQLDFVLKHIVGDNPDKTTIPLICDSLNTYIRSSQAGVEAADGKVKFWDLCENLLYQKGEIIDLDLYDESRTLVHAGPLARRFRGDLGYTLADLHVALLDSYLRPGGSTRYIIISRPIPLEYLRLAAFDMPIEEYKDKSRTHSTSEQSTRALLFASRSSVKYRKLYPFTIYHAYSRSSRRYTLYAASEEERQTWRKALINAIGIRKVRQESNMYRRVLKKQNVVSVHALEDFNLLLVHSDGGVEAYALDVMAGVVLGNARPQELDASREQVSGAEVAVSFVRVGKSGGRTMVLYVTKEFIQTSLHALEVVGGASSRRSVAGGAVSFRPFGDPVWIPRGSYDITPQHKDIGICTERGIYIVNPLNLNASKANANMIPSFNESSSPIQALKDRCSNAKPLGLVRVPATDSGPNDARVSELLVIYDELGCFINRHGVPSRSAGYVRWESKATSVAHRGEHVLLFSSEFIEIRTVASGKLVQVIEGQDIRLVHASERSILVAMQGEDKHVAGTVDKLVELVETAELGAQRHDTNLSGLWDEWDM
ncbi:hypothetical protein EIP86_011012 [Pleurotus ostreatoroseus]|nr:hypothetical protein EIP86_011012 [Pleurotus ostreatoroseus]